eukprot:4770707-Prymnesium_polylepis.1
MTGKRRAAHVRVSARVSSSNQLALINEGGAMHAVWQRSPQRYKHACIRAKPRTQTLVIVRLLFVLPAVKSACLVS